MSRWRNRPAPPLADNPVCGLPVSSYRTSIFIVSKSQSINVSQVSFQRGEGEGLAKKVNDFLLFDFFDREAEEIIRLVASVCLSVCGHSNF